MGLRAPFTGLGIFLTFEGEKRKMMFESRLAAGYRVDAGRVILRTFKSKKNAVKNLFWEKAHCPRSHNTYSVNFVNVYFQISGL